MANVIIKRKFSVPACGVKMKVYIDGVTRDSVWFTKPLETQLSQGRHSIKCDAAGVESDEIFFTVAENVQRTIECRVDFEKIRTVVL